MSEQTTRRQMLGHTIRGAGLLTLGGAAVYLGSKTEAEGAWRLDPEKCVNIRLGVTDLSAVCETCADTCVLPISAVKAVNEFAKCGRCCICPAYYDVTSQVTPEGLPSKKLCPRDAIERNAIGYVDEYDPLNNFYEYTIDEELCNGCGRCVMGCKEPAGLGSIRIEVRYDLCLHCNRCTIAEECPDDAYLHEPLKTQTL